MNKKLLSLALCVVMLASVLPLEAFAADIVTDPAPSAEAPAPVCTCETACAPAAPNAACPVCSAADASETVCAKYVAPAPVAPLSAPGGDEETSPSPTVTPTPEPTPAATPTPTPTPEPDPTTEPDPDRAARIAAVQALIDALPTPDAFSALPEAELEAATAQVSAAVDAYDALSSDEQAEVNAEALFALFALPEDPAEELEGETAQNFLVGENGYADINSAIDAVTDGGTIKVNADNLSFTINTGKTFTLDINGKTSTEVTVSGGTVTVTGSNTVDDITGKKFTVKHLVVSGGTVNFYSGIINSVDVSSGELNISGGYILATGKTDMGMENGNGVLTLTGGTATITGGSVAYVNLGLETKGDGTLNIKTATSADYMANVVGTLHYYGGTLNIDAKYNSNSAFAIYELDVLKSGLKLSNGKFNKIYISSSVSDLTPLDLLAPGWAYSNEYGIVDASDNLSGNDPYLITSHTCNATSGKCACGRKDFVAVVEYGDTNIAYPYSTGASQSDLAGILNTAFTEAANHTGCTVKLMTNVACVDATGALEYTISSGTFTLDLNGHSLSSIPTRIKESANVTIKDSGSNGTVNRLYISNNNPVCTVTGGTFNEIQIDSGTLNFQSGTVSGGNARLYITGGTANITGGTIDKLEVEKSKSSTVPAVLNVSNTTSTPTIKTLTYKSGTVSLTGGEYTKVTTAGTALTCIDLCASGYAFYTKGTGESGDSIANAGGNTLGGDESTDTYLVKGSSDHTCTYAKGAKTGKCTLCGRECPHTKLGKNSVCNDCGVAFLAEVTYTEGGNAKKEIFRTVQDAVNKAAEKGGTVTLLADRVADELEFKSGTYTLDLNGYSLQANGSQIKGIVTLTDSGTTKKSIDGNITMNANGRLIVDGAKIAKVATKSTSITVEQGELEVKSGSTVAGTVTVIGVKSKLIVSGGTFEKENNTDKVEINNGGAEVSGGTFNVPFIVTNDNYNFTTLSGGKFCKIEANGVDRLKNLLKSGYAYYKTTDDSPIALSTPGTTLENVTVKKCTHGFDEATPTTCKYCGQTFVVKVTYGETTEYFTKDQLDNAFLAAGSDNRNGTVTLLTEVSVSGSLDSTGTKYTLDLNGHNLTLSKGTFNVFGDVTLKDSGTTRGKLAAASIVVKDSDSVGKLTVDGAVVETNGANKLEVIDGGALEVKQNSTIKGNVEVKGTGSTLTVSGGTFDEADDSSATMITVTDGATANISGGTFSDNTQLQIFSSEVELSGGKFGCISIAQQGTTNTLPGILKANYEYKYYDGKGQVGTWTNGANLTSKSISRVEVKSIPIGSITITPDKFDLTYGESFTLNVVVKDTNGKDVNVDNDKYNWYVDTLNGPLSIEQKDRNSAAFTPDANCRQAGERTYRYEATVDGYTKSAEIKLTIKKAELTDEQKSRINPPIPQTLTYNPDISGGAYTGEGVSQNLFGVGNVTGLPEDGKYQYSFDGGKTWSENMSRSDAGTYDVLWRVNSPNYENYAPTNNKITGNIAPRPVSVASVTGITDNNKTYDGTPDLPQQSPAPAVNVSYTYYDTGEGKDVTKTFALRPADYALKLEYAKESGGNYSPDSAVGINKPILATLTLKNSNFVFDDNTKSATSNTVSKPQVVKDGQNNLTGKIMAATLTITAVNKTAYVGDPVPSLANPVQGEDFIVTGLAKGDTLESLGIKVKLVYVDEDGDPVTPDMTKPGTYKINPEVTLTTQLSNYGLPNCEKGTLTIEEAPEYTITASAGLNGSISPSGAVKVKKHQSQTFVITPNTGYVVANVKVDGVNLGSIRTYTFTDVTEEGHTIEATFMRPWGNPQTGVDIG